MNPDANPDLLDVIFELAGGGGGTAGRVRIWSALALVLAAMLAIWGACSYAGSVTTEVTAAKIEGGYNPRVRTFYQRWYNRPNPYQITGHLADIDAIVFYRYRERWRCSPLVSEGSDPDRTARVYYAASETHYLQARAANRYVGELYQAPRSPIWDRNDEIKGAVPYGAYLLFDDGSQPRDLASARSLLIVAAVIGTIALIAFLWALRAASRSDDAA